MATRRRARNKPSGRAALILERAKFTAATNRLERSGCFFKPAIAPVVKKLLPVKAADLALAGMREESERVSGLRDRLERGPQDRVPHCWVVRRPGSGLLTDNAVMTRSRLINGQPAASIDRQGLKPCLT